MESNLARTQGIWLSLRDATTATSNCESPMTGPDSSRTAPHNPSKGSACPTHVPASAIFMAKTSASNSLTLLRAVWRRVLKFPIVPARNMPGDAVIRTLLVDDEAPARNRLRHLLKGETDFQIIGECANGRQALELIQRDKPDLVFLDMQMPRLSGLEVCQALVNAGASLPLVVFVTAYDEYALKAFEVHALDYLLKPFDRERFQSSLGRVRSQLRSRNESSVDSRMAELLADFRRGARSNERLVFKENGRVVFLQPETIDWIEADGNYVRIQAGNESHYFR